MDRAVAPPQTQCPRCAAPLPEPTPAACPSCAWDVAGDVGRRLLAVEDQLAVLRDERAALIAALVADERAPAAAPSPAAPPPHRRLGAWMRTWLAQTGPQSLLAAGGVLLLIVAAIVFTAVTWDGLPALARGAVLLAAAVGAGVLTGTLARRGLQRTAEATAALAVALLAVLAQGLWDAGLLGGPDLASLVVAGVAALLAIAGHAFAHATGTRSPLVLASWLGPVALVAGTTWFAAILPPAPSVNAANLAVLAALVGAAVLAVGYAEWQLGTVARWRAVTQAAGVLLWVLATVGTALALAALVGAPVLRPALVAGAVGLGAGAVASALRARVLGRRARAWDLIGVAGAWFAMTTLALAAQGPPDAWGPVLTLAPAALGVAGLRWLDDRLLRGAAVLGMAPAVVAAAVLAGDVIVLVWQVVAAQTASPWTLDPATLGASPGLEPVLAGVLAVPVLAAAAAALVGRRSAAAVAVALGGLTLTAVGTQVWPAGGGAVMAVAVVAVAGQAALRGWTAGAAGPLVLAGSLVAVGTGLSGPPVTIVVLLAVTAAAAPVVRHDRLVAGTVTADVLGLAVAVTAWITDGPGPLAVALAVAAGCGLAMAPVTWVRPDLAEPVEGVALVGGLLAIAVAWDADAAVWPAWTFAVEAVAAAGIAVWRADRRALRWGATVLAAAASSTLLADAGVDVVEAHTMPPALVILGLSASALRAGRVASSWPGLGTGAGLLVLPTVLQLADDPTDLARLAGTLVLGVLLAAGGRVWTLQAPLMIGVAALVVAALTQHEVVTGVVPRWALLASGGALLLWLSISYERQLLRLSAARRHLAAMR